MRKRFKGLSLLLTISAMAASLTACGLGTGGNTDNTVINLLSADETYEKDEVGNGFAFEDMDTLYSDDGAVKVLYMTVGKGTSAEGTNYTWKDLDDASVDWFKKNNVKQYKCEAIVQFGNEDGPILGQYGYGLTASNATVKLNGTKASTRPQKNYKIDLKKGAGNLDGMKSFVLNKSFADPYRFTNKLAFDLMTDIPEMLSTRTSFVHLYVKDVTESKDTKFVDYGLYTMIEPVNKKYLKNRNLDDNAELYQISNFDWAKHEDVIMQPTNADFDKDRFEELIESKGSNDYSKLLATISAVNNENIAISNVVDMYFDKDSLYSWMAFNILMDNAATDTENYYICSPTGTDKFYFIAWDNDGALRDEYEKIKDPDYEPDWEKGMFLFTDSVLFRRILQDETCLSDLNEKIDELYDGALSPSNVSKRANRLSSQVKKYLYSLPDRTFARVTKENYDQLVASIGEQIETNYYAYYESIDTPWPFHITGVDGANGNAVINWEASQIIGGQVTYKVEIDNAWDFSRPFVTETEITATSYTMQNLQPGQYFVRVSAVSGLGNEQLAMEHYNTEKKTTVRGVMCFYVMEDGTVAMSVFE